MIKKRSIKKFKANPKIKPSLPKFNLQETSFNELSFKNKIIAVALLVLTIGVIASLFPGDNITGGAAISDTILRSIDSTDMIIKRVFPQFIGPDRLFAYEKFVLFLLLFTLLSVSLKLFQIRGIQNAVIALAISLISVWFIPDAVLAMIGLTYSATYASFLILVPVLIVGFLIWKMPPTRGGFAAKSITCFILMVIFAATKEGIELKYPQASYFALQTDWFSTFSDTIVLILLILSIWYLIRALTISPEDASRAAARQKVQEAMGRAQGKVADAMATGIANVVDKASNKVAKIITGENR